MNIRIDTSPHVFTCLSGVDFLDAMLDALMSGVLIDGFFPADDPLLFAATTIYLPTRRAERELTAKIIQRFSPHPVLLPRIIPLADAGEEDDGLLTDTAPTFDMLETLPPAISPVERRLVLTALIQAWGKILERAVLPLHGDTLEPLLVPSSLPDACAMAGDLARFLDDMTLWQATFKDLEALPEERFDHYFKITSQFLTIAGEQWPQILKEYGLSDPTMRRDTLLRQEAARLRERQHHAPVIVAGSTGTLPATAEFLKAVAFVKNGAIVLPALDMHLDEGTFSGLQQLLAKEPAAFTHPQAVMARLLGHINITRQQVKALGQASQPLVLREKLLSEALRPADTTDVWADHNKRLKPHELAQALSGVAMITATDEREEALAIAVAIREKLNDPQARVALITPDRNIAERVCAELSRWNIHAFDSAGQTLARKPLGRLVLLISELMTDHNPQHVQALVSHPWVKCGLNDAQHQHALEAFSSGVFQGLIAAQGLEGLIAHLNAQQARASNDPRMPLPTRRITTQGWEYARQMLTHIQALFQKDDHDQEHPISVLAARHRAIFEALTHDDQGAMDLSEACGFQELQNLIQALETASRAKIELNTFDYHRLISAFLRETLVHEIPSPHVHPRVEMWGLLEARLLRADRFILAGLDETIWPPSTNPDAFLTRSMRLALGLPPPEQRIGQTAHDFVDAMGVEDVIITRALKRGNSPTVESRFVQRLAACAGEDAWREPLSRGETYLTWARELDSVSQTSTLTAPQPCPPPHVQPTSLSVTEIETLIRDPYAIYGKHILKLHKLEGMRHQLDARDYGTWLHGLLEANARALENNPSHNAIALWDDLLDASFVPYAAFPETVALWQSRIRPILNAYTLWDQGQREHNPEIALEAYGRLSFPLLDGTMFTLRGKADRLEINQTGITLIDFKTGTAPSNPQVTQGLSPQLTLEAALWLKGGFKHIEAKPIGDDITLMYIKLGGKDVFKTSVVKPGYGRGNPKPAPSLPELIESTWQNLAMRLMQHREGAFPFISHYRVKNRDHEGEYDHLARFKEWSATGGADDEGNDPVDDDKEEAA